MRRQLKLTLVITVVAGCAVAAGQALGASQALPKGAALVPSASSIDRSIPLHEGVDRQMRAAEHHAKVRMILYPGRFGQTDIAKRELEAIAFKLNALGKLQKPAAPFTLPLVGSENGRQPQTGRR